MQTGIDQDFKPNSLQFLIKQYENTFTEERSVFFRKLVNKVQQIFDQTYILSHKNIQQQINTHPKGSVPFSMIFRQPIIVKYSKQNGQHLFDQQNPNLQTFSALLCSHFIMNHSHKLWASPVSVRRIVPHSQQNKQLVFIDWIDKTHKEQLQTLLNSKAQIFQSQFNYGEGWAVVLTDQPQKIKELDGHLFQNTNFPLSVHVSDVQKMLQQARRSQGWDRFKILQEDRSSQEIYPCMLEMFNREGRFNLNSIQAKGFIQRMGLDKQIVYRGHQEREEMNRYNQQMDRLNIDSQEEKQIEQRQRQQYQVYKKDEEND